VSPYWRHLLLTVVLAGAAGFLGVWVGASRLAPPPTQPPMLPNVVNELRSRGLHGLTAGQETQLNAIAARYGETRAKLRRRITAANFELADSLAEETQLGPKTQAAIDRLKNTVGEMQQAAVVYVLDLRQVLTPEQRVVFDDKVVEALMTDPA
jgi:Spy/CpxP family protein refolding chaperone